MRLRQVAKLSDALADGVSFESVSNIAIGGRDAKQRVAVVDSEACCVYVISLEDMKLLWVAGSKGQGPGQFMEPVRAAFDGRGYLYVSDDVLCRVEVFDCEGKYVRYFGQQGSGPGELSDPWAMSLSGQGDILVCDWGRTDRVYVFDGDGRYVRDVPSPDDPQKVRLNRPRHVSSTADGNIIVADDDCVRVFSRDGLFVRKVKRPHVQGVHWNVHQMCSGPRGELVAYQWDTRTVRVLDADGALLWTAELDDEWALDRMAMGCRGQLLCVPDCIQDVYVCKPEPCEAS
jgi:outer membrane protein assembly factor BamB